MKILLVNYRYFISGGPEKYMFNIMEKLEAEGHEVIPFSIHSNKNMETEYSRYFVEPIGSRDAVYYDDYKKTPRTILQMISRSVYSFSVKRAIKRAIAATKPDLVYILHFINKLSPSVIKGAKEMGLPVVLRLSDYFLLCPRFDFLYQKKICEDCLIHGYRSCIRKRCIKGSLSASLIRVLSMKVHRILKVYKHLDAIIAPSEFLLNKLSVSGFEGSRINHIPTFTSGKKVVTEPEIGSYGLYFGRITEEKGVDTLIRAYELLGEDYRLMVVGDDTTEEGIRLKEYVKEHGLKQITFTGFQSGAELEGIIKNARFTLIPSIWYDNLPNTALEAFHYYKPVLASNIGSLPELVIPGVNGYLFEAGNAEEAAALIRTMEEDELVRRMGVNSHRLLQEQFSAERHYNDLMTLFRSLVPGDAQEYDRAM